MKNNKKKSNRGSRAAQPVKRDPLLTRWWLIGLAGLVIAVLLVVVVLLWSGHRDTIVLVLHGTWDLLVDSRREIFEVSLETWSYILKFLKHRM